MEARDVGTKTETIMTINGVQLTGGQMMTVHVALNNFATDLLQHGLGNDEHGKRMTGAYLETIRDIHRIMGIST
jgi:hypothetical protein